MSNPALILARCHRAGLRVWRNGSYISIAPARLCPPDLVESIRAAKPQLLKFLDEPGLQDLTGDCLPWVHTARQVLGGEFDHGDRSLLESLLIGVRNIPHPACWTARSKLETMLSRATGKGSLPD
ncbi:MAG: hypothetical protein FJ405_10990 [Verrucomicrobia bacterium]|nr:hypothetical protein [Verrucomicrobiota bacterium]